MQGCSAKKEVWERPSHASPPHCTNTKYRSDALTRKTLHWFSQTTRAN